MCKHFSNMQVAGYLLPRHVPNERERERGLLAGSAYTHAHSDCGAGERERGERRQQWPTQVANFCQTTSVFGQPRRHFAMNIKPISAVSLLSNKTKHHNEVMSRPLVASAVLNAD